MKQANVQLNFADYAAIVWQRRRLALLVGGLIACAVLIVFNCLPRQYTATVVFERRGDIVAAQTDSTVPASFATLKPMLAYELTNPSAVRQALDQVGFAERLPKDSSGQPTGDSLGALNRISEKISGDLHLKWLVNSNNLDTVSVSMTDSEAALVSSLLNQLVNNYISKTRQTLLSQLSESASFIEDRIKASQEKITLQRAKMQDFLQAHPNTTPENPQKLTDQMRELDVQLEDLQQHRSDLETRLSLLADQAEMGHDVRSTPEYQEVAKRLTEYQEALADAQNIKGMKDQHPRVLKLKHSIAEAQQQLKDMQKTRGSSPSLAATVALEDVQTDMRRADTLSARKRQQREELAKAQANALPVINEYQLLNSQLTEAVSENNMWQRNRATVQVALDAERNGTRTFMKITRPAGLVYKPTWPALWHVFCIALLGGVGAGAAAAIGLARLSRKFSSPSEAASALALPLLGVIGPIFSPATSRIDALRRYVLMPAAVCLIVLVMVMSSASIVLATQYPSHYVLLKQQLVPTAWAGLRQLMGAG